MVKKNSGNRFIEKAVSCPPELIGGRVSRWGVAKVHVKDRLLRAAGTFSRHPSFVSINTVPEYSDSMPVVLVGPVIGLVTTTTARILLEVDRDAIVDMVLHQESSHNGLYSDDFSYSESFMASVSQRLRRGVSSPAWIRGISTYKPLLRETALVDAINPVDSTENPMHSCGNIDSMHSMCNDEEEQGSKENSTHSCDDGSMHSCDADECNLVASKLRQKVLSKSSMQRASSGSLMKLWSSKKVFLAANTGYESPGDVSTSISRERRPQVASRAAISSKRGSGLRSSFSPRSSHLDKQASAHYLQQGGGSVEGSTSLPIIVRKKMKARRPCVFEFVKLEPDARYGVEVKGCNDAESSSFKTFPHRACSSFRMASISCNSIFITNRTITSIDNLWSHLYKLVRSNQVDLLLHLGDQIYGDGDRHLDAGAGKDRDKWSNRFKIGLHMLNGLSKDEWDSKQEEICEKYREVYRDTWKHPATAKCLANCPSLMIYDDHEIRDNWGDISLDRQKECKEFFVARCAWIATLEYQRQLYEDVDFSHLEAIQKDYHFHVIGKVGLMFLDIRGSRTFHRVEKDETPYLGSKQWEEIQQALRNGGLFDGVQVLVVCSPAPLVFLIPSLTRAAHNMINRLEDFKGHWSVHKPEQRKMIECLREWKKKRGGREVIVLGGDVHCGGHSCILEADEILFYQLTTSPIANMPLSKTVYYAMRFAEQLEHIQDGFKFRHFNWTRARNYGLVHVNFHVGEDEQKLPEIIMQLVRGKFLRPVRMGKRVSNLEKKHTCTACSSMFPIHWCKTRMFNMAVMACDKTLLSGSNGIQESIDKDGNNL